jgi:putative SOS response-associated peptidase YedK
MCGRFTYRLTWEEIVRLYRLTLDQPAQNTRARYNICPTTTIDTIVEREGKRELARMRWGLVPSWWSKPLKELKLATFNARAETVAKKPFFRSAFKRTRCLIVNRRSKIACRMTPHSGIGLLRVAEHAQR